MEGLLIVIFGGMLTFIAGAVYGGVWVNRPKTLVYSLLISVSGFITSVIAGNVIRILVDKNPDNLGSLGEILGAVFLGGFLCISLGIGAIIAGSIRLIAKDQSSSRPKISE